jgi:hypothetical protein
LHIAQYLWHSSGGEPNYHRPRTALTHSRGARGNRRGISASTQRDRQT